MKLIIILFKVLNKSFYLIYKYYSVLANNVMFAANHVTIMPKAKINGILNISVAKTGLLLIGENARINSGKYFNRVGRPQKTTLIVGENAILRIGNNVKMSNTVIVCQKSVTIGNNVGIGANTVIYDTDFHNISYEKRVIGNDPQESVKRAAVLINDGVFIGGHCLLLKGVTIGEKSIVGAGSVVTRSIPPGEMWGGNPAKFIKKL